MKLKQVLGVMLISAFSGASTLALYVNYFQPAPMEEQAIIATPTQNSSNNSISYANYSNLTPTDFSEAAERTVNAVVHVANLQTTRPNPLDFMFGYSQGEQGARPIGMGSGVIISPEGYIVTNYHVIKDAEEIEIKLNNGKTYMAELVGADPSTDIALINIDADNLSYLQLTDSDQVQVGEWVLAVGNPFNLNSTVTAGIVSALNRNLGYSSQSIASFIQTDAAVNPGNSGGALVNTNGDLVGINTAISTRTGSFEGYSFAVPSNIVQRVVKDLMDYGTVNKALLGIRYYEINSENAKELETELSQGIFVSDVVTGSAASKGGLKDGDIITEIDGKEMNKGADLKGMIDSKRPGDRVAVTYLRDKEKNTINVTLLNSSNKVKFDPNKLKTSKMLGASIRPLREGEMEELRLKYGLMVEEVNGYPFSRMGIQRGDVILEVNDNRVDTADDLQREIKSDRKTIVFTVRKRNGSIDYLAMRMR